jgi:hypothetical protein
VLVAELVVSNVVSIAWAVHEHGRCCCFCGRMDAERRDRLVLPQAHSRAARSQHRRLRKQWQARAGDAGGAQETANFLAMHYGFFHVMYAIFLVGSVHAASSATAPGSDPAMCSLCWCWELRLRLRSTPEHRRNVAIDRGRRPNIGAMMFLPYLRVVPMHLIIIGGAMLGGGNSAVIVFGALKTVADVGMLILERRSLP